MKVKAPHPAAFVHTPGAHRVPLTLLAATVAPPEGSEWASLEEMAAELGEDPVEGRIVAELDDQWRAAGGRFRGAIRVVDGAISNGCHRFGALWRLGADTVDVWVADDDHPDPTWADPKPAWEVTVRLTDGAFTDDDENFDRAVCAARSFPLANGWVDGDVAYARGAELSVSLYCDTGRAHLLGDAVVARLATFGVAVELVSVTRDD